MNGVPASCQFLAQLRANNSAAAVRRINSNADVHKNKVFDFWSLIFGLVSRFELVPGRGRGDYQFSKTKDQRPNTKMERQATLAIACLFLNLSRYLSIGGASEAVQYMPLELVWQSFAGPN